MKATAKKIAKSMVGKSIGSDQRGLRRMYCRSPALSVHASSARARCGPGTAGSTLPTLPAPPAHAPNSGRAATRGPGPRAPAAQPLAFSASMSAGSTLCTSPTIPRSATEKIGASWSLLMAMMFLEPFIPTRCWVAPEIPHAM